MKKLVYILWPREKLEGGALREVDPQCERVEGRLLLGRQQTVTGFHCAEVG